jgi:hypothetical protein
MEPVERKVRGDVLNERLDDALARVEHVGRIVLDGRTMGSDDPPIPKAVAIAVIVFILLIVAVIALAVIPVMLK